MLTSTFIGGIAIVLIVAVAWFLFRVALWTYQEYRVNRDFNKNFYRKDN